MPLEVDRVSGLQRNATQEYNSSLIPTLNAGDTPPPTDLSRGRVAPYTVDPLIHLLKDPLANGRCIKFLSTGTVLQYPILIVPPNKDNLSIKDKCPEFRYQCVLYSEVPLAVL